MKIEIHIDERIVGAGRWLKATLTKRRSAVLAGGAVLLGLAAIAQAVTKPHTFSSGQPALASQVNENFDALFDAVTAVETKLDTVTTSSMILPGNFLSGTSVPSFDGYSYVTDTIPRVRGSAAIQLPPGTVMTNLTCYFYNNSDIAAELDGDTLVSFFSTALRRKDMTDLTEITADTLALINEWPAKDGAIQEFTMELGGGDGIEVEAGSSYTLYMEVVPGSAPAEEFFPPSVPDCAACNRVLRHYGCRIDYELP